jgi:hypothetical protein
MNAKKKKKKILPHAGNQKTAVQPIIHHYTKWLSQVWGAILINLKIWVSRGFSNLK